MYAVYGLGIQEQHSGYTEAQSLTRLDYDIFHVVYNVCVVKNAIVNLPSAYGKVQDMGSQC